MGSYHSQLVAVSPTSAPDIAELLGAILDLVPLDRSQYLLHASRRNLAEKFPECKLVPGVYPRLGDDLLVLAEIVREAKATQGVGERLLAMVHSICSPEKLCSFILNSITAKPLHALSEKKQAAESIAEQHASLVRALDLRLAIVRSLSSFIDVIRAAGGGEFPRFPRALAFTSRCHTVSLLVQSLWEASSVVSGVKSLSLLLEYILAEEPTTTTRYRDFEEFVPQFFTQFGNWLILNQHFATAEKCLDLVFTAMDSSTAVLSDGVLSVLLYVRARALVGVGNFEKACEMFIRTGRLFFDNGPEALISLIQKNGQYLGERGLQRMASLDFLYHCVLVVQSCQSTEAVVALCNAALLESPSKKVALSEFKDLDIGSDERTFIELDLTLGTTLVLSLIERHEFEEAYSCLSLVPDFGDRRRDCFRKLILAMCENGAERVLCRLPLVEWVSEAERTLLLQAQSPNYAKILYSFYANRSDFKSAAGAMYQYADRLRERPDGSRVREVLQALLVAKNALGLVDPMNQWLTFSKDKVPVDQISTGAASKVLCIVDSAKLNLEIKVSAALLVLLDHFDFEGNIFELEGGQILEFLVSSQEFVHAFRFARDTGLDLKTIFYGLASELYLFFLEPERDQSWLERWFEGRQSSNDAVSLCLDVIHECLQAQRSRDPSAASQYYGQVMETLLQADASLELPCWFYEEFSKLDHNRLVRIFWAHGLLHDANSLVNGIVT